MQGEHAYEYISRKECVLLGAMCEYYAQYFYQCFISMQSCVCMYVRDRKQTKTEVCVCV